MNTFLRLGFVPRSYDFGLLVLRVVFGLSLCVLHGWGKVVHFTAMSTHFPDPLHIGPKTSLLFAIFSDLVCSLLITMGLATRWASLIVAVNTAVAFALIHNLKLSGPGSGELAFLFFAWALTLLITGPGRYSIDRA